MFKLPIAIGIKIIKTDAKKSPKSAKSAREKCSQSS